MDKEILKQKIVRAMTGQTLENCIRRGVEISQIIQTIDNLDVMGFLMTDSRRQDDGGENA